MVKGIERVEGVGFGEGGMGVGKGVIEVWV